MAEVSLVEKVPHLHANAPVPAGLCSLHCPAYIVLLRFLHWSQPHHHVQRLPLLVSLPRILQTNIQEQAKQVRCEWQ